MRVVLAVALIVSWVSWIDGAVAQPRSVRVVWLPTQANSATTRGEVARLGNEIARAVGGELAPARDAPERAAMVAGLVRAAQLLGDGAVDEAADAYDAAIARGRRSILELGDATELEHGLIARIGIALARGESSRARELATWLVRVDPTFAVDASENQPRLVSELAEARRAPGPLAEADLGDCRPGPQLVVVVRTIKPGELELRRLDGCRLGDPQLVTIGRDHRAAVHAIVGIDAITEPAARPPGGTAIYRRPWFWVAVGVVAVGGAGTAYYIGAKDTREVVPHW